jgi:hypothetical protein
MRFGVMAVFYIHHHLDRPTRLKRQSLIQDCLFIINLYTCKDNTHDRHDNSVYQSNIENSKVARGRRIIY